MNRIYNNMMEKLVMFFGAVISIIYISIYCILIYWIASTLLNM